MEDLGYYIDSALHNLCLPTVINMPRIQIGIIRSRNGGGPLEGLATRRFDAC
jgi:hypothetical protein